jgi:hypothetical protein
MADEREPKSTDAMLELLRELKGGLKGGSGLETKLAEVLEDNAKLRAKLRTLRESPQVKPGELVLSADDAKAWERYRKLGEPEEVRKAVSEGQAAKTRLGELETAETYREAARLQRWQPGTFARFAKADGLRIAIEEGDDKDGKPVRTAYVMGEGDRKTPLLKYAEAHWRDELPALQADPDSGPNPGLHPNAPPRNGLPPRERRAGPAPAPGRGTEDEIRADQLELVRYQPL